MTRRIWSGLAMAIAVGAMTAGGIVISTGGSGSPGTANAFVNLVTTGDTCTRSATAITYAVAEANNWLCGSFDAAHGVASPGDLILVRDGDYTDQAMNGPNKAGANITIQAENIGGVTVDQLDVDSVGQITFKDFTVTNPGFAGNNNQKIIDLQNSDNLIFDNVDIDRAWARGDGLGVTRGVDNLIFRNGSICCNIEQKLIQIQVCCDGSATGHSNLLFENVTVHGAAYASVPPQNDPHFECWWIEAVNGITLRNVLTYDCGATGNIFSQLSGANSTITNLLFQNTIWESKRGWEGNAVDIAPGAPTAYLGDKQGLTIDGIPRTGSTGIMEYSIFEGTIRNDTISGSQWTSLLMRANVLGFQSCGGPGFSYQYNKVSQASCGGTNSQVSTILQSSNYVDTATHNWRSANCSTPLIDGGTTTSYPTADFDGVTRYLDAAPDLGPFEKDC